MNRRRATFVATGAVAAVMACGGESPPTPPPPIDISTIIIDGGPGPITIERGTSLTMTATARDAAAKTVVVPFAWRSSNEARASFGPNGMLTVKDTGDVIITASALGITSAGLGIRVVWEGAAKIARNQFNPPLAITPGTEMADSVRVLVTNLRGGPAVGAIVAFAVTQGGGSVKPALDTVGANGFATTKWALGSAAGTNTVTATVVGQDRTTLVTWVQDNPVSFTVKSYMALAALQGDAQTASVLAPLPVVPVVRLVDTAGRPRAGIPVSFAPTNNGRVANTIVSTTSDGQANPGVWTLGDATGDQQLVVTVENARFVLHANATGSTVRFAATRIAATQTATCAMTSDQFVSCFGTAPQIGTGDTASKSTPTLTRGSIKLTSLVGSGGGAHFCGTSTDASIYCWGINSFVDTTGVVISSSSPTRLQSNTGWTQVTPGGQHNCALANDGSAFCWGIDTVGQLGDNGTTRRYVPQPVQGGFKFSTLAAGASHQCGITQDRNAFCWGLNGNGQIGDGTQITRRTPTAVSTALKWKAIGAGSALTCGLTDAGVAYCWGAGTGATPIEFTSPVSFSSLSVGAAHACALASDGRAYCWGDNGSGQLGDSTTTSRQVPTPVASELRFSSISAGPQHTCALTLDGFVACWGRNTVGELGFPNALIQLTPRYVVLGVKP
ncbi:MAG TPA: hypothetical protein VIP11_27450 [Gemmatimonadaceae bacterium]